MLLQIQRHRHVPEEVEEDEKLPQTLMYLHYFLTP